MKVLVVEDEQKTAAYLQKGLTENGFVVDVADRGELAVHLAKTRGYDLMILDVMLPGVDGATITVAFAAGQKKVRAGWLTMLSSAPVAATAP